MGTSCSASEVRVLPIEINKRHTYAWLHMGRRNARRECGWLVFVFSFLTKRFILSTYWTIKRIIQSKSTDAVVY